ncbi:hypothetical protein R3P38DRAFT_189916 [Favolaschia claudopus]|uniref:Secreted protein n=1 Tax=Favolaschia claudopus TaxID=2862362 RepID=A0AAW0D3R5_9AGAR
MRSRCSSMGFLLTSFHATPGFAAIQPCSTCIPLLRSLTSNTTAREPQFSNLWSVGHVAAKVANLAASLELPHSSQSW